MHYVMTLAGEMTGTAIGLPFDLAYQCLCKSLHSIYEALGDKPPGLTGFRIADGKLIMQGMVVEANQLKEMELTPSQKEKAIIIQSNGCFKINNLEFNINKILPEVITELKQRFVSERIVELDDLDACEDQQHALSPSC